MTHLKLFIPGRIRCHSGTYINPLDPQPHEIMIGDIAHGLSLECRFGKQTQVFYSVAEHCIRGLDFIPEDLAFQWLMHDASEAYLPDMPTPIKNQIPGYKEAEHRLMKVIAQKFGFEYPMHRFIKVVDHRRLKWEWENIVIKKTFEPLPPHLAKAEFLRRFNKYNPQK